MIPTTYPCNPLRLRGIFTAVPRKCPVKMQHYLVLTNSIEQDPSWEANSHSSNQSPDFYGTRRFIAVFIGTHPRIPSWARRIQSTPSHPVSLWSVLISHSHLLRLIVKLVSSLQVSWPILCRISHFFHACYMPSTIVFLNVTTLIRNLQ
jgi:hypothetical protein